MSGAEDLPTMVKRVGARVLAERGRATHPVGRPESPCIERTAGVFIAIEGEAGWLRPQSATEREAESASKRGAALITADDLRGLATGSSFSVPRGALVTELARDEAWKRRIALVESSSAVSGARSDGRLRVALGADHGGFALKQAVSEWLRELGHVPLDLGTHDENPVDYPDYARAVAEAVAQGRADLGIAIDGAGIGSCMAANKVPGVRAAMCYDVVTARNAREHNFANVLTLGGKLLKHADAQAIVRTFLSTPTGEERHARRVDKIMAIEMSPPRVELRAVESRTK